MEYLNPLLAPSLNDDLETNSEGREVYKHDCHNLPICMSYGQTFSGCRAGSTSLTEAVFSSADRRAS